MVNTVVNAAGSPAAAFGGAVASDRAPAMSNGARPPHPQTTTHLPLSDGLTRSSAKPFAGLATHRAFDPGQATFRQSSHPSNSFVKKVAVTVCHSATESRRPAVFALHISLIPAAQFARTTLVRALQNRLGSREVIDEASTRSALALK